MRNRRITVILSALLVLGGVQAVAAEDDTQIVVDGIAVGAAEEGGEAGNEEWVDGQAPSAASAADEADPGYAWNAEVQPAAAVENAENAQAEPIGLSIDSVKMAGPADTAGTVGALSGAVAPVARVQTPSLPDFIVFDEASVNFEGTWVPFADGFQIYLPSAWNYYVISDEEAQDGVIYKAGQEDGSCAVAVTYAQTGGVTEEELMQWYQEDGLTGLRLVDVNSIPCVTYRAADGSYKGISFLMEDGALMFAIAFAPCNDAANLGDTILCSVKPYSAD